MPFQITALPAKQFRHLFGADKKALETLGATRMTVDSYPGFPCRISLEDVPVGEAVLLLNYEHQAAMSPYRSRHAIFVREHAEEASLDPGDVPEQLRRRLLSIRAFDADDMMIEADVAEGSDFERPVEAMLAIPKTSYLHVHYAKRGCYAARVDRA